MADPENIKAPGSYVKESAAFPPSIIAVETAVPAFIGYTEKAEMNKQSVFLKPIKIASMEDFETVFGGSYKAVYNIEEVTGGNEYDFSVTDTDLAPPQDKYFRLKPASPSTFNLYNSMRLFYANGSGSCYVVSVGDYAKGATIKKGDLLAGLDSIKEQVGPTMLVIPDAVLLPNTGIENDQPWKSSDFRDVTRAMLAQCGELQDRFAILDVYGAQYAEAGNLTAIADEFHEDVGDRGLSYGAAYFQFLDTTVVSSSDYDYTSLSPLASLTTILGWENKNLNWDDKNNKPTPKYDAVQSDIERMADAVDPEEVAKLNQSLIAALPLLGKMLQLVAAKNNVLPASGAMAGVYTFVDSTRGVWNAPANITLNSVDRVTLNLNDQQQGDFNMPLDGKAIDVIRDFVGRGTVVWGARTLDGNSNDYRYIQVRRTIIYIEQSIKNALNQFVFAPNDGNTWVTVVAMVSNFLQGVWSAGGLMGATASEAFSVECGLGSTMTPTDILEGYMVAQVTLQMMRPAEFIELTFKQKMEGVS
jgi:uncharacterized protein